MEVYVVLLELLCELHANSYTRGGGQGFEAREGDRGRKKGIEDGSGVCGG